MPFAPAGLAVIIALYKARKLLVIPSTPKETLPNPKCTMASLSNLNSTFPFLNSSTALAGSAVTVPLLGLGIRPLVPNIFPNWPILGIKSGVAMAMSKSSQPPLIFSTKSSCPTKSAPAFWADMAASPTAKTKIFPVLPKPAGIATTPRIF